MNVDETRRDDWARMQADRKRDLENAQDLQSGGGGGTFDGMEARVAKLESGVDELKKAVAEGRVENAKAFGKIEATLAGIEERTKHMATKWEVVIILGVMTGLIGGVVALAARFLP